MNKIKKVHLVCGEGINDLTGETNSAAYKSWKAMITRCYSKKSQEHRPSYIGCSVSREWLIFSEFKRWHDANYVDGFQLDKDLLVYGNKIYSKETCAYVPRYINSLLIDSKQTRGKYPRGVTLSKRGKYQAKCSRSVTNQINYSSQHSSVFEAARAYCNAKILYVRSVVKRSIAKGEINEYLGESIIHTTLLQLRQVVDSARLQFT
jgi:hypothetical protein